MNLRFEKIKLTPGEKNLTKRALVVLGTFTCITVVTALASMLYTQFHQPMIVPKIIGMDENQAEKAISSKGLHLKVTRSQYDEHVPLGLVSEQVPKANSYAKRGQTVKVVLSKGNPKVKVPLVVEMSFPQAQIRPGRGPLEGRPRIPHDFRGPAGHHAGSNAPRRRAGRFFHRGQPVSGHRAAPAELSSCPT